MINVSTTYLTPDDFSEKNIKKLKQNLMLDNIGFEYLRSRILDALHQHRYPLFKEAVGRIENELYLLSEAMRVTEYNIDIDETDTFPHDTNEFIVDHLTASFESFEFDKDAEIPNDIMLTLDGIYESIPTSATSEFDSDMLPVLTHLQTYLRKHKYLSNKQKVATRVLDEFPQYYIEARRNDILGDNSFEGMMQYANEKGILFNQNGEIVTGIVKSIQKPVPNTVKTETHSNALNAAETNKPVDVDSYDVEVLKNDVDLKAHVLKRMLEEPTTSTNDREVYAPLVTQYQEILTDGCSIYELTMLYEDICNAIDTIKLSK